MLLINLWRHKCHVWRLDIKETVISQWKISIISLYRVEHFILDRKPGSLTTMGLNHQYQTLINTLSRHQLCQEVFEILNQYPTTHCWYNGPVLMVNNFKKFLKAQISSLYTNGTVITVILSIISSWQGTKPMLREWEPGQANHYISIYDALWYESNGNFAHVCDGTNDIT